MTTLALSVMFLAGVPAAGVGPQGTGNHPTLQGTAVDPAGDALPDPRAPASPDLISAAVRSTPGGLDFLVRFAPRTLAQATTFLQISFDVDDAHAALPAEPTCGEFLVDVNTLAGDAGQAAVSRRDDATGRYSVIGRADLTWHKDSVRVAVPASALPPEFNRVVFRVTTAVRLEDRATTPILDTMPNSGVAVAVAPRERMSEWITAMFLAVVAMSPLAQADAPSAQLSVDGTAFWIGQTEAAARQAIPRGYSLEPREGGWTLRANSLGAQPYLIRVTVSKGRVTRVGFNWPAGSCIHMDAYSAILAQALSHGESCRITGATNGQGALIRRMEFLCGGRRLIGILGDWPMGSTADITLE